MQPDFLENMFFLSGGPEGCIACVLVQLKFMEPLQLEKMNQALLCVQNRYPNLQIFVDVENHRFIPVAQNVELDYVEVGASAEQLLEKELSQPLEQAPKPSWRLTAHSRDLISVDFAFTIHHILVDGISVQNFFRDLLLAYEHICSTGKNPELKIQNSAPFSRFLKRKTVTFFVRFLAKVIQWSIWSQKVLLPTIFGCLKGDLKKAPVKNETKIRCITLDYGALNKKAKSCNLSPNSLITSAFAKAYGSVCKKSQKVDLMEAVDLRREFSVPQALFGVYVFSVPQSLQVEGNSLKNIAIVHKQQLHRGRQALYKRLLIMRHVLSSNFVRFLRKGLVNIREGRGTDLLLSNWGNVVISTSSNIELTGLYFRASYPELGPQFHVGSARIGSNLHLSIGYQERLLSKESAEKILSLAVGSLRDLGNKDEVSQCT